MRGQIWFPCQTEGTVSICDSATECTLLTVNRRPTNYSSIMYRPTTIKSDTHAARTVILKIEISWYSKIEPGWIWISRFIGNRRIRIPNIPLLTLLRNQCMNNYDCVDLTTPKKETKERKWLCVARCWYTVQSPIGWTRSLAIKVTLHVRLIFPTHKSHLLCHFAV